ncbi:MAG TPA: nucleotidyltransferase family protein [Pyrinomonadaceae bacterium]
MRDEEEPLNGLSDSAPHPSSLIPHPSLSAILLAAGRSRRMGAFKPLLPFGEVTVVERCVSVLREGGANDVVVVVGHRAEEVRAGLAHLPFVRFAFNEDAESEMGVSVARGVESLSEQTEAVLVALVDQPAVPAAVVREIVGAREESKARLVVPTWEGRGGHPVLIDLRFRDELLSLDPAVGLRALFDAHRAEVLRLGVGSPYVVRDMDTWEEYCALHAEVLGRPPDARQVGE